MAELLDPSKLLEILEGNRRLTIRTIQAFSEEDLFQYTPVEPMRPFETMAREIIAIEDGYCGGSPPGSGSTAAIASRALRRKRHCWRRAKRCALRAGSCGPGSQSSAC